MNRGPKMIVLSDGRKFRSVLAAATALKITYYEANCRLKEGLPVDRERTVPRKNAFQANIKGVEVGSWKEACKATGLSSSAIRGRIKSGISLDAPHNPRKSEYSVPGFPSVRAAAKAAGISHKTAYSRLRIGLGLSDPHPGLDLNKKPVEVAGVVYGSRSEASKATGLAVSTIADRIKAGIPLDAPRWPGRAGKGGAIKYGGATYRTLADASKATGLTRGMLRYRIHHGKEDGTPKGSPIIIGEGSAAISFPSIRKACDYMGIPYGRVQNRKFKKLPLRDCFGGSERPWPVPRTIPAVAVRWLSPAAREMDFRCGST